MHHLITGGRAGSPARVAARRIAPVPPANPPGRPAAVRALARRPALPIRRAAAPFATVAPGVCAPATRCRADGRRG